VAIQSYKLEIIMNGENLENASEMNLSGEISWIIQKTAELHSYRNVFSILVAADIVKSAVAGGHLPLTSGQDLRSAISDVASEVYSRL
jgi:hypothetical protein